MESSPFSGPSRSQRVRDGDRAVLAAALDEHRTRLLRLVTLRLDGRLSGRVSPDDVLQEAFLNASQRHAHVEGDSEAELFVWLRLIVLQTIADVHRRHLTAKKRGVGREIATPADGGAGDALAAHLLGSMTSPSGALRREETAERVRTAIGQLSETDREMLALRHFEELSNQEVAAILSIEEKAASIRYFRALRRLRAVLEEAGVEATAF